MKHLIALALALALVGLPAAGEATAAETIEYKLAVIDADRYVPKDHITVARFRSLLRQLTSKFNEDREQIADMSVKAQQLLRDEGIDQKMLEMMEGINRLFPQRFPNQRYGEYAAAYVSIRIQGQSHNEALGGLQALLEALGVR